MNNTKVIVSDMDDVLVNITPKWIANACSHYKLTGYEKLQQLKQQEDFVSTVINRDCYYLQEWLQKSCGIEAHDVPYLDEVYRQDEDFYLSLEPTKITLQLIELVSKFPWVSHLHVVTHCFDYDDPCNVSKRAWFEAVFEPIRDRVTLHILDHRNKKCEYIIEKIGSHIDLFLDDSLRNITDIVLNEDLKVQDIMIPQFVHNDLEKAIPQLAVLAELKGTSLKYYHNEFLEGNHVESQLSSDHAEGVSP